MHRKNISLMKINNIMLVLCTRKMLLFSFMIYFFSVYVIQEVFLLYHCNLFSILILFPQGQCVVVDDCNHKKARRVSIVNLILQKVSSS